MIQIPVTYSTGQAINEAPVIYLFENIVSSQEIAAIIGAASSRMERALVSSEKAGVLSEGRTGDNCWLPHNHSPETFNLAQRVSELVGIELSQAESFQVIHYGESQKYAAHYDGWDADTIRGQRCMSRGGQRLVTCLIYLNNVAKGGGTVFPKLGLEIQAVVGRMVVFHNCLEGTNKRHPGSLHGGLPVEKGEKWAVNLWFREKPCH
ncbi:2OG-Fe(II) oxygenase [Parendozoicomonas sp. Alg238-R29]|uniref:prolyl hydroxylase family protein n=1 Tax=Parendozoicomonas sp. Alg238-R29 TaxID=2993446 RepID=UPI00248E1666|nr:2OG-Fe(II) oxygenase [Parendozoicomonas sp. Alg238-R29]